MIGLFDVDSKMPNLALMKISAHYKQLGFKTERYSPLLPDRYIRVFASKIFRYPHPNDLYLRSEMVKGGPGFNNGKKLPEEIEHAFPDYSLYNIDYAMGHLTRGCSRDCEWCIVPGMEGTIRKNAELEEFCDNQKKVLLLDNNILAYKNHLEELKKLLVSGKKIDFNQGLDIRLINEKNAKLLSEIPRWKGLRLRFAFDEPYLKSVVRYGIKTLNKAGIKNGAIQFYVLIGFDTNHQENLMRVNFLKKRGIAIFVMPFDKTDPYQMKFARWVNRYFYKYQTWEEFKRRD